MISQETKTIIWISIITVAVVVLGLYFWNKSSVSQNNPNQQKVFDRLEVVALDSHILGLNSAKVIVTEFGDYECPACGAAHPVTKALIEKYKNNKDVAFAFRHYPLPQHRNAIPAAEFAEAAGMQGKFWEMHDLLYKNQGKWLPALNTKDIFTGYAKELGLDLEKLKTDIKSETVSQRIKIDKAVAEKLGINSTPTFFVNGTMQSSWGEVGLSDAIDKALAE